MPLLNKQKFVKNPIPQDLDPNEEVFFSKLTLEIFRDYDEYFERTILCNSLVWTCSLSGKTGLTYAEAVESEERAARLIENFPASIFKPILYLITLTKRGNIKDVIDDIFSFAKDRYFIGETCLLNMPQSGKNEPPKQCKIVEVIVPGFSRHNSSVDDVIESVGVEKRRNSLQIDSSQIKYVVEIGQKPNGTVRQTVRGGQLARAKNQLTKEKIYIIVRLNCEAPSNGRWQLTDEAVKRHRIDELSFADIFGGEAPQFEQTFGRGQFSRANQLNQSKQLNSSQSKPSSQQSNNKKPVNQQPQKGGNKSSTTTTTVAKKPAAQPAKPELSEEEAKILADMKDPNSEVNQNALLVVQVLNKQIVDMDEEEFEIWRDYTPDDEDKELKQLEIELEKIVRREEKEREKERIKNEKNKQKEYLKELKKPKEDLECDSLVELPKPIPIKSKITQDMFGDSIMILEFLNYFGDLFELKDDFPNGFNFDLLENALFSKSCDSALCNLLLFFLDSVFKCYDEETFEDSDAESDDESDDEDANQESDSEEINMSEFYKEPHKESTDRDSISQLADQFFHQIKNIQGRSLKTIGLDVYTISEMLRLYFITSGSLHTSKVKYWYQQRGGYTHMDECGIDFVLNERHILKKLEYMNVYELEPNEKLKILTCLCHQLISQIRFRDLIDDNFQKLNTLRAQLRDLQTEENRRIREEVSERWKRKMMAKEKEKARAQEILNNAKPGNKESSTLISELTTREEEMAKIAEEKFNSESNKKREEFLKKESKLVEEIYQLQTVYSMCPLGKDRYFRRYWVFKSLPGVFVEDDDEGDDGEFERIRHPEGVVKQEPTSTNGDATSANSTNPTGSVANEDENKLNGAAQQQNLSMSSNDGKENKPDIVNGQLLLNDVKPLIGSDSAASKSSSTTFVKGEIKWSFYYTSDLIDQLINNLNERGQRESELKQNLTDFKSKIIEQIEKSPSIVNNLTMSAEDIEKSLRNCLKENVYNVLANLNNQTGGTTKKSKNAAMKGAVVSASNTSSASSSATDEITSQQHMEIDLRDKLLDIGEQISIGALGSLKVTDRYKWREAIERGEYEPMCANLVWGDLTFPAAECTNGAKKNTKSILTNAQNSADHETTLAIVNNYAKILLQIEQSVERRFIQSPLNGDHTKSSTTTSTSKKGLEPSASSSNLASAAGTTSAVSSSSTTSSTAAGASTATAASKTLANWERSLASCTTLSQLFIHLQTLDEAITWSKSILNARCCVCKKKRDADKMLLCDKCDRGHHLYCLRPALTCVPDGEWFCPKCKPKDVEKTPRKIRESFGHIYSDGDESVNQNDESNDTTDNKYNNSKKRRGAGLVNGKSNHHDEDGSDEENDEEDEIVEPTSKSKKNTTTRGGKSVSTAKQNGNHKAVNFTHSDEDMATESGDDGEKRRSSRKKKQPINAGKVGTKQAAKTTTRSKISSSSLTSVASSTNSSYNSSEQLKTTTTRSTRNRSRPYSEINDDLSANGTDDDSAQSRPKRAKKNSEEKTAFASSSNTSSRNTEMGHRMKLIEKILNDMMKSPDAWPFLKPVSKRNAPGYFAHIKTPMDFSTIKNNINNFKYTDYTKIISDIRLTFDNCWKYNEPGSDISETGKRLAKSFEQQAKAAGLLDYSI